MAGPARGREAARNRAQGGPPAGTVATTDNGPAGTMRHLLDQMKPELALALPRHMTPERMARQALTAFRTTKGLDECTPQSFLGALMTCAQVGLEPGPQGHVYLIPFRNRRNIGGEWRNVMEVTFILGYQGMLELARRSGELVDVSAHTIYANEVEQGRFRVLYGSEPKIHHEPIVFGDRGAPIGYYAAATLKSGGRPFVVLSRADVEAFRARSATQKAEKPSGPWETDYEAMAWKTCVRRLSRWLPQSPELAAAVAHEETAREHMPSERVSSVLEEQPPALEEGPDETPAGVDPTTGEVQSGGAPGPAPAGGQPPSAPAEPPNDDPWANVPDPTDPNGDDPWATPSR